jgi:hypothetical protein
MHTNRGRVATAVAVSVVMVVLAALFAPAASAAIPLGGGAGIVVDGTYCTLTTIGHDNTGALVGFTAAHCGGPGAQVVAEGAEDHGPLGSVVAEGAGDQGPLGSVVPPVNGLDYSVIRFDAAKVAPIANFDGFAINGIGVDADWHEPVCKLGAAAGEDCRYSKYIPRPGKTTFLIGWLWQPGDDGAPVTIDGLLVGLIRDGYIIPGFPGNADIPETRLVLFSAILEDVNSTGGPGAGFVPVPS